MVEEQWQQTRSVWPVSFSICFLYFMGFDVLCLNRLCDILLVYFKTEDF